MDGPANARRHDRPGETPSLPAASHQRFELVFEVGAPGIAEGGALFLLPDPFWYWSDAQTGDPAGPGYTTAVLRKAAGAPAKAARLVATGLAGAFCVEGRALAAGEEIAIVYGAGAAGAVVDRYAERGAEIRIGLDADADGHRAWLPHPVVVDIAAREGELLIAYGPAEVLPGEDFALNLALVDAVGNRAHWPAVSLDAKGRSRGEFEIESLPTATLAPSAGLGPHTSVVPADSPHRAARPRTGCARGLRGGAAADRRSSRVDTPRLGRSPRPHALFRRERCPGRLLPVCTGRGPARRHRAHRP